MNFQAYTTGEHYTEQLPLPLASVTLTAIFLRAETDRHDTPVQEIKRNVYRNTVEKTEGHLFFLRFPLSQRSLVYILPVPDHIKPTLTVQKGELRIACGGYPVVRGECRMGEESALCRSWYRTLYHPQTLIAMSNTWGDRGGREVVTEKFVKGEIDCAQELGIDVVQVDDGWQMQAPNVFDENGNRVFEDAFWQVQESVFPNGIASLSPYAEERGVKTGLWFAPHSRNDFEHLERDVAILRRAFEEWGFRYFKLDMLQLNTKEQCARAEELIRRILSFGEEVSVELDVTADKRLGYLASAPYGTLFIENRYSAWGNYYPHATLRNLWCLSEYVPAAKMQFELLNPKRFTESYREDDPLRPSLYDIDYLFASVMVSNPLFWMEMQHLPKADRETLRDILTPWKLWRHELVTADVCPIGEEPSGASLTGFLAKAENATHLILLREATERNCFSIDLSGAYQTPTLLASNAKTQITVQAGNLQVTLEAPRSYAWIRLSPQA